MRVFISYAHASGPHVEAVRQLWTLLRAAGVDARLDLPATRERQDWALWTARQVKAADFVLVVASAAYRRRAEGEAAPDEGRGVQFEAGLLRDALYADRPSWTRKLLPVILPGESAAGLPAFLSPASATTYKVKELSPLGLERLISVLHGRPAGVRPPVADLRALLDALLVMPEFAGAPARHELLLLLPPAIRGAIHEAPNARLHVLAILQGCARFGEPGRTALLDLLRTALPDDDPRVRAAIGLLEEAELFG